MRASCSWFNSAVGPVRGLVVAIVVQAELYSLIRERDALKAKAAPLVTCAS